MMFDAKLPLISVNIIIGIQRVHAPLSLELITFINIFDIQISDIRSSMEQFLGMCPLNGFLYKTSTFTLTFL